MGEREQRRVRFVGEVVIDVDPANGEIVAQDVQNEIGFSGVVVIEIEAVSNP